MKDRVTVKTSENTVRLMEESALVNNVADSSDGSGTAKDTEANTVDATEGEDANSDTDAEELEQAANVEGAAISFLPLSSPCRAIASALQCRGASGDEADTLMRVLTLLRQTSEELDGPVLAARASSLPRHGDGDRRVGRQARPGD